MKQPNTGGRRRGDVKKEQGEEQGEIRTRMRVNEEKE